MKHARTTFAETVVAHFLPGTLYLVLGVALTQGKPLGTALAWVVGAPGEKPMLIFTLALVALILGVTTDALRYLVERYLLWGILTTGYVRDEIISASARSKDKAEFAIGQMLSSYHYAEFCGNFGIGLIVAGIFGPEVSNSVRWGMLVVGVLLLPAWMSVMRSIVESAKRIR